jgi:hypothetical protein
VGSQLYFKGVLFGGSMEGHFPRRLAGAAKDGWECLCSEAYLLGTADTV